MRSRFPILWLVQFVGLVVGAVVFILFPGRSLERYTGDTAPDDAPRPQAALVAWVLGIESVPSPNAAVADFFRRHPDMALLEERLGGDAVPDDVDVPEGLSDADQAPAVWPRLDPSITTAEWDAMITWVLGCRPPPDPEVTAWFESIDEVDRPTLALADWVSKLSHGNAPAAQSQSIPPHHDLREWLLGTDRQIPFTWTLAKDQVRSRVPPMLAAALFTLLGLLSPTIRRPLARVFFLVFLFWSLAHLRGMLGPTTWSPLDIGLAAGFVIALGMAMARMRDSPGEGFGATLFAILILWQVGMSVQVIRGGFAPLAELGFASMSALVMLNAYYWLIGPSEDPPQDDAGIAQSRPPQMWSTWALQFVFLFSVGVIVLLFPDQVLELLTDAEHDHLATKIVDDQMRLNGAGVLGMGLFSFFALRALPDWIWRGIAWIFVVVFSAMALQTVVNAISGEYTIWNFVFGFQGLLFVPITLKLLHRDDPWFADNVEKAQEGWSLTDLFVALPMVAAPLLRRRRRAFDTGVAAAGRLRVAIPDDRAPADARPPSNDFFVPGRELEARVRFSNFSLDDDGALDIRGCALRLVDPKTHAELTLLMASGAFSPAGNADESRLLLRSGESMRGPLLALRRVREGLAAGLRRAPSSYLAVGYYSQTVRHWWNHAGVRFLVRFRLVPVPGDETGCDGSPSAEDLDRPWPRARDESETRPPDYLRRGLREQIATGPPPVVRREARLHDPEEGDSDEWYDPTEEWQAAGHPWIPLGQLRLERLIEGEEARYLRFDPLHQPGSIKIPQSRQLDDPRWLGAVQARIVRSLSALRLRQHLDSEGRPEDAR